MRLLFAIAHYYRHDPGNTKYGSMKDDPTPRIRALAECVATLHGQFGRRQYLVDHSRALAVPANRPGAHEVEVVICTTGGHHLLPRLPLPEGLFSHRATDAEPLLLGFECQAALRDRLGEFDYYCYLEDDIIPQDPWMFAKLDWFNASAGPDKLLQPNRFELSPYPLAHKLYCDGDLNPRVTAPYQNLREKPELSGNVMGTPLRFRRPSNPHAGCYFLSAAQFDHWVRQPFFLDRDTRFIGPLESAATLGIMRAFKVYKAAPPNASFLEVKHYGARYLCQIGDRIKVEQERSESNDRTAD